MNTRILGPKFVKRANAWCLTFFSEAKSGVTQTQEWFSSKEEATAHKLLKEADAKAHS